MDTLTEDLGFITEEQLDFTFGSPVSDSSEQASQEVEEEVFVGPVKHVERCVVKSLDLNAREGIGRASPGPPHWTPLSAEKFEEVCREANRLARQLEKLALKENLERSPLVTALIRAQEPRRSPRRETYVVKDSPVRLLLPDVSLEGISLLSLNGEEGLASPSSPINNISDTTPKRKVTPKVCKTTPAVRSITRVTDEVKPTGKTAPATKKTTPTAHAGEGTPKGGCPATSPKKEVTLMKSRAKASDGPAAMPATGHAVPVTSLHRQCVKPGQGLGRGQRSNGSSAALHPGNGSQDGAAAAIRPSLSHRTLGAKKKSQGCQQFFLPCGLHLASLQHGRTCRKC